MRSIFSRRRGAAALIAALFVASSDAHARNYTSSVAVDTEDELRLLYEDGLLDSDEFDTLVELLNNPININTANRSQLYDLPTITIWQSQAIVLARTQRRFESLNDLLQIQGIDTDVLAEIQAFAWTGPGQPPTDDVHGRVRLRSAVPIDGPNATLDPDDNPHDSHTIDQLNPMYTNLPRTLLVGQVRYQQWLEVGVLGLAQEDLTRVTYDPERQDFYGAWGTPVFELGRIYAKLDRGATSVIVGHYNAGFGLGLTFDRTSRLHPNGFYTDLTASGASSAQQTDYGLNRSLFGVAANMVLPDLGGKRLEMTAFASSARYDLYQYDIAMAGGDPLDPMEEEELTSPRIYIDGYKVNYLTLPNAYRETLGGLNWDLGLSPRNAVGVTAWLGHLDRTTIDGVDDPYAFVIRSGYPTGDTYGAVGAHANGGAGPVDVFAEGSVTFTGGWGALAKAIWTPKKRSEVELSLRHYASDFDNPHARGLAASDEYAGMRDRDEQGVRLKTTYDATSWLNLRFTGDVWRNLSVDITNANLYARAQAQPIDAFRLSVFGQHINRNLAINGRSRIYGGDFDSLDEFSTEDVSITDDTEVDRAGARYQYGSQIDVYAVPMTTLSAFYRRNFTDSGLLYPTLDGNGPCEYWFQIGHYMWLKARVDLFERSQITARVRYQDDDVHGSLEERFIEGYLQWTQKLPRQVKVSLRGTLGQDLYDPASEWKTACDLAGFPELSGSCVATDDEGVEDIVHDQPYGLLWVSAEVRF